MRTATMSDLPSRFSFLADRLEKPSADSSSSTMGARKKNIDQLKEFYVKRWQNEESGRASYSGLSRRLRAPAAPRSVVSVNQRAMPSVQETVEDGEIMCQNCFSLIKGPFVKEHREQCLRPKDEKFLARHSMKMKQLRESVKERIKAKGLSGSTTMSIVSEMDSDCGTQRAGTLISAAYTDVADMQNNSELLRLKDEDDQRRWFYSQCLTIKLGCSDKTRARRVLISDLYTKVKEQKIPVEQWATWIKDMLNATDTQSPQAAPSVVTATVTSPYQKYSPAPRLRRDQSTEKLETGNFEPSEYSSAGTPMMPKYDSYTAEAQQAARETILRRQEQHEEQIQEQIRRHALQQGPQYDQVAPQRTFYPQHTPHQQQRAQVYTPHLQHAQPQQGVQSTQQYSQPQQGVQSTQQYSQPQQGVHSTQQYSQPQQGVQSTQQYSQPQQVNFASQQTQQPRLMQWMNNSRQPQLLQSYQDPQKQSQPQQPYIQSRQDPQLQSNYQSRQDPQQQLQHPLPNSQLQSHQYPQQQQQPPLAPSQQLPLPPQQLTYQTRHATGFGNGAPLQSEPARDSSNVLHDPAGYPEQQRPTLVWRPANMSQPQQFAQEQAVHERRSSLQDEPIGLQPGMQQGAAVAQTNLARMAPPSTGQGGIRQGFKLMQPVQLRSQSVGGALLRGQIQPAKTYNKFAFQAHQR